MHLQKQSIRRKCFLIILLVLCFELWANIHMRRLLHYLPRHVLCEWWIRETWMLLHLPIWWTRGWNCCFSNLITFGLLISQRLDLLCHYWMKENISVTSNIPLSQDKISMAWTAPVVTAMTIFAFEWSPCEVYFPVLVSTDL